MSDKWKVFCTHGFILFLTVLVYSSLWGGSFTSKNIDIFAVIVCILYIIGGCFFHPGCKVTKDIFITSYIAIIGVVLFPLLLLKVSGNLNNVIGDLFIFYYLPLYTSFLVEDVPFFTYLIQTVLPTMLLPTLLLFVGIQSRRFFNKVVNKQQT